MEHEAHLNTRLIEYLQRKLDELDSAHHARQDREFERVLNDMRRALGEAWLHG